MARFSWPFFLVWILGCNLKFNLVFLAGGNGSRMASELPKQYVAILQKPIWYYSLRQFLSLPSIDLVIIVCEPQYQRQFTEMFPRRQFRFALPGSRRQDSLHSGLSALQDLELIDYPVCIHDAARPLVDSKIIAEVLASTLKYGAAACGVDLKSTIKKCSKENMVIKTLSRDNLREIQTPQAVKCGKILLEALEVADKQKITVSDDVSLVELLNLPVNITKGSYLNFKITTKEDLSYLKFLLNEQLL